MGEIARKRVSERANGQAGKARKGAGRGKSEQASKVVSEHEGKARQQAIKASKPLIYRTGEQTSKPGERAHNQASTTDTETVATGSKQLPQRQPL